MPLRHRLDFAGIVPIQPLQRVLLHAAMSVMSSRSAVAEVAVRHRGVDAYDQRALLMAGRDDVVVVQGNIDKDYLRYLGEIGVGPSPSNVIELGLGARQTTLLATLLQDEEEFDRLARQMPGDGAIRIDPFIARAPELDLCRKLGARLGREVSLLGEPSVVERVNRKDVQRQWALELEVPVAEGGVVELEPGASGRPQSVEPLRAAITRYLSAGQGVLLRGCEGASGSATRIVAGQADLEEALAWAAGRDEASYLVDRYYDVHVSPNVLVFVPPEMDRPVSFVAATDQILDAGLTHAGNRFPSRANLLDEMVAHAELLGRRLQAEGYAGWVGCDFCEYNDPVTGKPQVFFAELNARINGACYPANLAAQWRTAGRPLDAFMSGFLKTGVKSFSQVSDQLSRRLLRPESAHGVLPYNTGCLAHGYCAAVVVDTTPEATARKWDEIAGVLAV